MTTALQVRVKEVHPEVCFYVMNGNRPLPYSKRSSEGLALRRRLTERRGFGQLITQALRDETTSAKGAKHADVLDACAACWTAERIHGSRAIRIPDSPARDAKGLSMEIWA
jgi:predicted RNase H-like nuclease